MARDGETEAPFRGAALEPGAATVSWRLGASGGEIDPGPADRVKLEVTSGGRAVGELMLPALGALSPARVEAWLAERLPYLPLRATLGALRPWRSARFWTGALTSLARVRGLGLGAQLRRRRPDRDILKAHLKRSLSAGLLAALPGGGAAGGPAAFPDGHGAALAELKARLALEPPAPPPQPDEAIGEEIHEPSDIHSAAAWDEFFSRAEDPWNYRASAYEKCKYEQTLEALNGERPRRALELGCAEGLFTEMLAPQVETLLATDISAVALQRAQRRCSRFANVEFGVKNFVADELGGPYDLIVCSEALYYAGSRSRLRAVIDKFTRSLAPGGLLLMANANQVADEPDHSGFDWGADFGSKTIGETVAAAPGMRLEREIETPLYRIHLFRKARPGEAQAPPILEKRPLTAPLEPGVAAHALWKGGISRVKALHTELSATLPILMYHRIADDGPEALARFRVSPGQFADHIELLRSLGYVSVTPSHWLAAKAANRPLAGRPVLITFDDGYADLEANAWPILKRREFTATVFVVTDHVGGRATWDAEYGEPAPLMDWSALRRLASEGLDVGSHGASHRKLTQLTTREIYEEALRSRSAIAGQLGRPPISFCYPHGDYDSVTAVALAECGYSLGFSCSAGRSTLGEDPFALSRIEVTGDDDADALAAKLALQPG